MTSPLAVAGLTGGERARRAGVGVEEGDEVGAVGQVDDGHEVVVGLDVGQRGL